MRSALEGRGLCDCRSDGCDGRRSSQPVALMPIISTDWELAVDDSESRKRITDPVSLPDPEREAFQVGNSKGMSAAGYAGDCPHMQDEPDLRFAWMEGFSEGRAEMRLARE